MAGMRSVAMKQIFSVGKAGVERLQLRYLSNSGLVLHLLPDGYMCQWNNQRLNRT